MNPSRIFLLSPAHCGGKRAALLFREQADFDLARRLRDAAAPLGEVFAFISGLYFRGKLAYARSFARAPGDWSGILVITAGRGLVDPETPVTLDDLRKLAEVPVDLSDPRYRSPLEGDVTHLADALPVDAEVVLLGSVATGKYVELLAPLLGSRLRYPEAFVGMGDMQRGSIMLKAAAAGEELRYAPLDAVVRRKRAVGEGRS